MKLIIGFSIGLFVCVLALLSGYIIFFKKTITTTTTTVPTTTTSTTVPITTTIPSKTELDNVLEIIRNATDGKNWTTGLYVGGVRYNCGDFTKNALLALRSNGYNETTSSALCNEGLKPGNWHYWINVTLSNGTALEIEPQNLNIITDHSGIYSPWGRRCVVRGIW